jgi:hypothetical protein
MAFSKASLKRRRMASELPGGSVFIYWWLGHGVFWNAISQSPTPIIPHPLRVSEIAVFRRRATALRARNRI